MTEVDISKPASIMQRPTSDGKILVQVGSGFSGTLGDPGQPLMFWRYGDASAIPIRFSEWIACKDAAGWSPRSFDGAFLMAFAAIEASQAAQAALDPVAQELIAAGVVEPMPIGIEGVQAFTFADQPQCTEYHWWTFHKYNASRYGFGTEAQAIDYLDRLNKTREPNTSLWSYRKASDNEMQSVAHLSQLGFNLEAALDEPGDAGPPVDLEQKPFPLFQVRIAALADIYTTYETHAPDAETAAQYGWSLYQNDYQPEWSLAEGYVTPLEGTQQVESIVDDATGDMTELKIVSSVEISQLFNRQQPLVVKQHAGEVAGPQATIRGAAASMAHFLKGVQQDHIASKEIFDALKATEIVDAIFEEVPLVRSPAPVHEVDVKTLDAFELVIACAEQYAKILRETTLVEFADIDAPEADALRTALDRVKAFQYGHLPPDDQAACGTSSQS